MVESSNLVFSPVGKLYKTVSTSTVFTESQTQRNGVRSEEKVWPRGTEDSVSQGAVLAGGVRKAQGG